MVDVKSEENEKGWSRGPEDIWRPLMASSLMFVLAAVEERAGRPTAAEFASIVVPYAKTLDTAPEKKKK